MTWLSGLARIFWLGVPTAACAVGLMLWCASDRSRRPTIDDGVPPVERHDRAPSWGGRDPDPAEGVIQRAAAALATDEFFTTQDAVALIRRQLTRFREELPSSTLADADRRFVGVMERVMQREGSSFHELFQAWATSPDAADRNLSAEISAWRIQADARARRDFDQLAETLWDHPSEATKRRLAEIGYPKRRLPRDAYGRVLDPEEWAEQRLRGRDRGSRER